MQYMHGFLLLRFPTLKQEVVSNNRDAEYRSSLESNTNELKLAGHLHD